MNKQWKKSKMKNLIKEKGITLIALVVTIIVLLILAGVSISMLTGQNGILKRAAEAKEVTGKAQVLEQIKLSVTEAISKGLGTLTTAYLENGLNNNIGTGNYAIEGDETEGWTITVPKEKVSYFVDGNGEVTEVEYEEPIDNSESLVLGLVDDLGTSATIYLYGNTDKITSGSIIITMPDNTTKSITATSDNTNITSSSNYTTYTVNKNGVYTFSATDGTTTAETKIRVKNIEKFTAVESLGLAKARLEDGTESENAYSYKGASVPVGYYVDTKTNVDTGLVITDEIDAEGYSTGNEWVWVPVNSTVGNDNYYEEETSAQTLAGTASETNPTTYTKYSKLYSFSQPTTRDAYGTFYPYGNLSTDSLGRPSGTSGYREPSLLTDSTYGESANYSSIDKRGTTDKCASVTEVASQYISDYNNMIESVENYGGFYIGRYEITANGEKPGDSLSGTGYNWYSLYNECMKFGKEKESGNSITESGMIYGTLWDATMQWLAKSNINVGYTGNTTSGYGNYQNEAVTVKNDNTTITVKAIGTGKNLKTGQTSYTKSNNIYDLSGNHYDWTQEAQGTGLRVLRGGNSYDAGSYFTYSAARYYTGTPTNAHGDNSSRAHFYIK